MVIKPKLERLVEEAETQMVRSWNGRGEPWCVIDPHTGKEIASGKGALVLRHLKYCKDVTPLFENLSPDELGLEDFTDMGKSWLENHASYGDREGVFPENIRKQLDSILDAWNSASRDVGTGRMLRLCHEADIPANVDAKTLAGKIVSHYHPTVEKGLTKEDRRAFYAWNLLQLRVATKTKSYFYPEESAEED